MQVIGEKKLQLYKLLLKKKKQKQAAGKCLSIQIGEVIWNNWVYT